MSWLSNAGMVLFHPVFIFFYRFFKLCDFKITFFYSCITAKSMRQYGIDHPNIRMKEILNTDSTRIDGLHEGPFGIKTKFADEHIQDILQAKYTDFRNEDSDYPAVHTIQKKGFMPVPKSTIASQSIVEARLKKEHIPEHHRFIMKRFQNIKGTFEKQREEEEQRRAGRDE